MKKLLVALLMFVFFITGLAFTACKHSPEDGDVRWHKGELQAYQIEKDYGSARSIEGWFSIKHGLKRDLDIYKIENEFQCYISGGHEYSYVKKVDIPVSCDGFYEYKKGYLYKCSKCSSEKKYTRENLPFEHKEALKKLGLY